jgi:YfiH family protein
LLVRKSMEAMAASPPEQLILAPNGVALLLFFRDIPALHCGLSLKAGGVSEPPFASLNLGGSTADRPEALAENRRRFYQAAEFEPQAVARMHQVHGAQIRTVSRAGDIGEADGMVTREPGLVLLVSAADCLPVFFADLEAGVIGALHAGWRGIVAGVIDSGVEAARAAGAAPERLRVTLGPAIGGCCFEVGEDVAERFDPATHRPGRRGRPHLDLAAAVRLELTRAGVDAGAIRGPWACTRCRTDLFFSARAGEPTGRMVGFVARRPPSGAPAPRG